MLVVMRITYTFTGFHIYCDTVFGSCRLEHTVSKCWEVSHYNFGIFCQHSACTNTTVLWLNCFVKFSRQFVPVFWQLPLRNKSATDGWRFFLSCLHPPRVQGQNHSQTLWSAATGYTRVIQACSLASITFKFATFSLLFLQYVIFICLYVCYMYLVFGRINIIINISCIKLIRNSAGRVDCVATTTGVRSSDHSRDIGSSDGVCVLVFLKAD